MNEEEKKAIEFSEEIHEVVKKAMEVKYRDNELQALQTIIKNQQKEIEEMKQNKFSYEDWVMRTRISKDKIREIIYPSPDNYIPVEVQMSEMYRKIKELVKESEIDE